MWTRLELELELGMEFGTQLYFYLCVNIRALHRERRGERVERLRQWKIYCFVAIQANCWGPAKSSRWTLIKLCFLITKQSSGWIQLLGNCRSREREGISKGGGRRERGKLIIKRPAALWFYDALNEIAQ